jgi:hypothetical protein
MFSTTSPPDFVTQPGYSPPDWHSQAGSFSGGETVLYMFEIQNKIVIQKFPLLFLPRGRLKS